MSVFFQSRKFAFLNTSLLFVVLIAWCVACSFYSVRNITKYVAGDSHLFYGTVSHAAIPSLFGGTDIPFLDRTMFQLNGNSDATFILYTSREINEEMAEWFSFSDMDVSSIPLEIHATRVADDAFVVTSLSSNDGDLDEEILMEYQIQNLIIVAGIVLVCFVGFIVFLVLGIRTKVRREPVSEYSALNKSDEAV